MSEKANSIENFFGKYAPFASANDDMSRVVTYYNGRTRGGCMLTELQDAEYTAEWFDPRIGKYSVLAESLFPDNGS